tara:strand:+ start:121 stop:750 length:630 start_codon:yes stop_codon:yes gene_type:complete
MSKIFVDEMQGNTSTTISIPSGQTLNVAGNLSSTAGTISGTPSFPDGAKVNTIKHTGGTTAMTINTSGQILMPNRPAFDAAPTANIAHGTNPIPMTNVRINNGNHFNASNGTFTAPITGTYFFFMNWIGGNTTTVRRFYFRYNGNKFNETHARLDTSQGEDYNATGLQIIKVLNANETMAVSYQADDNSSAAYSDGAPGYQGFGGFLLY